MLTPFISSCLLAPSDPTGKPLFSILTLTHYHSLPLTAFDKNSSAPSHLCNRHFCFSTFLLSLSTLTVSSYVNQAQSRGCIAKHWKMKKRKKGKKGKGRQDFVPVCTCRTGKIELQGQKKTTGRQGLIGGESRLTPPMVTQLQEAKDGKEESLKGGKQTKKK